MQQQPAAGAADVSAQLAGIFAQHATIDLSLPLADHLPCTWPGHMPFRATVWSWFEHRPDDPQPVHADADGACQTRWLVIDEHTGTHLDAPRHFIPPPGSGLPHAGPGGDIGIDQVPLLAAAGPAAVLDASALTATRAPGVSARITPDHLRAWEQEHGPVRPGEVMLLRGDWDDRYRAGPDGSSYGEDVLRGREAAWPAPEPETIEALHERGVRCVGTDAPSIGPAEDGGPAHLAGLTRGMAFVEGLAGLRRLPPRGAYFLFLPIRLVAGTGGPGRALAVLPDPPG